MFVSIYSLAFVPIIAARYYYSETVYEGVTCGFTTEGNDVFSQTGYSFGECIIGYDSLGVAVSSAIYESDCTLKTDNNGGTYYEASYTLYGDLQCSSEPIRTATYQYEADCKTDGDYTTVYSCTDQSSPPYTSINGGYVFGYTSTYDDCKGRTPLSWTWYPVKECIKAYGEDFASYMIECYSDTSGATTYYVDDTCTTRKDTVETDFDQCLEVFDSKATSTNPSFENYLYGSCRDSSTTSNDDEVTLSEGEYAGRVVGVLIGGSILGAILCFVILYCCCMKLLVAAQANKLKEKLVDPPEESAPPAEKTENTA